MLTLLEMEQIAGCATMSMTQCSSFCATPPVFAVETLEVFPGAFLLVNDVFFCGFPSPPVVIFVKEFPLDDVCLSVDDHIEYFDS